MQLVALSLVMLVGSYTAGSIPLFIALSEEKLQVSSGRSATTCRITCLQLVSVLGAGLLLGTALSVIIPEGMQTLHTAYTTTSHVEHVEEGGAGEGPELGGHHMIGVSLVLGFLFMLVVDAVASSKASRGDVEAGRRGAVSWTATLGLVVHAAADGVALGAAATTHQTDGE